MSQVSILLSAESVPYQEVKVDIFYRDRAHVHQHCWLQARNYHGFGTFTIDFLLTRGYPNIYIIIHNIIIITILLLILLYYYYSYYLLFIYIIIYIYIYIYMPLWSLPLTVKKENVLIIFRQNGDQWPSPVAPQHVSPQKRHLPKAAVRGGRVSGSNGVVPYNKKLTCIIIDQIYIYTYIYIHTHTVIICILMYDCKLWLWFFYYHSNVHYHYCIWLLW